MITINVLHSFSEKEIVEWCITNISREGRKQIGKLVSKTTPKTKEYKGHAKGGSHPRAKRVYVFYLSGDLVGTYETITFAAINLKLNRSAVKAALRRKRPLHKIYWITENNYFDYVPSCPVNELLI